MDVCVVSVFRMLDCRPAYGVSTAPGHLEICGEEELAAVIPSGPALVRSFADIPLDLRIRKLKVVDLGHVIGRRPEVREDPLLLAHTKACRAALLSTRHVDVRRIVPSWIVRSSLSASVDSIRREISEASQKSRTRLEGCPDLVLAVSRMEKRGTRVDVDTARALLDRGGLPEHEARFLRSVAASDGFLYPRYDLAGTRTGRFGSLGGFNFVGIPGGLCRRMIVSRWEGGRIFSLDYNAIDYRSLVACLPDCDLKRAYGGADDFHLKTQELLDLGPTVTRDVGKGLVYSMLYGAGDETVRKLTGLSQLAITRIRPRVESVLAPLFSLRDEIVRRSRAEGHVEVDGLRITLSPEDHDGKVLGLFAQGYSSAVFRQALVTADWALEGARTTICFTVHDELVLDVHPDELDLARSLARSLSAARGGLFSVSEKEGKDYEQASS